MEIKNSMQITMKESPYLVEPSKNPQKALKYAIEKGLFKIDEIDKDLIKNYLDCKKEIPIWIIEAACKLNENFIEIPVKFQYLWFCLSKVKVKRRLNQNKILNPEVDFFTVYVEPSKKIINLIEKAISKIGTKTQLGELCCVKRQTIYQNITKRIKPNLMTLLKVCQILKKNVWKEIDNHKLYSYSNSDDDYLLFKNYQEDEIIDLLVWIKLEGHLPINRGAMETSQKDKDSMMLEILRDKVRKLYQIKENHFLIYNNSINKGTIKDWRGSKLTITCSPLRQIFCLRYNIPLGYKCSFIEISKEVNSCQKEEDKYRLISTVIETEGSIINYGSKKSPIVSITSASKRFITQLERLLRDLKYNPYIYSHNIKDYELRIQGLDSISKLHYNIYPYFNHPSKKSKFLETLKEKSLIRLKIENNQEIINMIKNARDMTAMSKNINKDLAERINSDMVNIFEHEIKRYNVNGWISSNKSVALLPFLMICKILKTDYFKFIPKHHASILWANNLFSKEELNKIRGAK